MSNESLTLIYCQCCYLILAEEKLSREMVMKLSDIKRAFQYKLAESDPGSDLGQSGFNEKMVDAAVAQAGTLSLPRIRRWLLFATVCPYVCLTTSDILFSFLPFPFISVSFQFFEVF